ncbi:MAG: MFS transporter [Ilumatobacteraceae bacterium]
MRILGPGRPVGEARTVGEQVRGAVEAVRHPIILTVVVAGFLLFVVIFGVFLTALPVHLENEFGLGPGARGLVLSSPAIGSTVAAWNSARVRARVPIRLVLAGSSVLIAIAAFGVAVAPAIGVVLVVSVIYGLGDGTAIPALQDVATSAAPASQRASVMAAWVSAVRLGQAVGPIGAAALFGATSTTLTMIVGAAIFAVVAVVFVLSPLDDERLAAAQAGR